MCYKQKCKVLSLNLAHPVCIAVLVAESMTYKNALLI